MFKINLVPEVQEKKQKIAQLNYIVTVGSLSVLGVIVVILVVIGGLIISNKTMKNGADKDIAGVNTELSQYSEFEKTVLSLENGLAGAKQILDGKNAWTKLLPHIEKASPADIQYTKISLETGKITASLKGSSINSLARFVESYKRYEMYTLSGSGRPNDKITVLVDSEPTVVVTIKSDGQWVYPITFNPDAGHKIIIQASSEEQLDAITYDKDTKEIKSENGKVNFKNKALFSNVEVSEYKKEGSAVSFDAKMEFDGAMLW